MQWVVENWIWILLGVGMIAMHLFGHGGHGRRGGHGARRDLERSSEEPDARP
jgi:hypothetical protein